LDLSITNDDVISCAGRMGFASVNGARARAIELVFPFAVTFKLIFMGSGNEFV